jgi:ribose 5-phosphate isomerase RpiB
MRIAVVSETSAGNRNADILAALKDRGHQVINAGMKESGAQPELTYIHTGLIAALLLNLKRVDFVVGGCGTGQGFLNSVLQYPGVVCGHVLNGLDAWLFAQINGGNCISLALNQGYGWAGDVNLRFIFDRLLEKEFGAGYPPHRSDSQRESRAMLGRVSEASHRSFPEVLAALPREVIEPVLNYPGMDALIDLASPDNAGVREALQAAGRDRARRKGS